MKRPGALVRLAGAVRKAFFSVPSPSGWLSVIREGFAGAYQSVVEIESPRGLLGFAGLFSPVTLISGDVAKLRVMLCEQTEDGIWQEVTKQSPYAQVLRNPNRYQTRVQFWEHWILCKLLWGNVYVYKVRDARGIVTGLFILDPQRVTPLVTTEGDVYYRLSTDNLSGIVGQITVRSSEIIHDRWNCLWHPLVGVSPIYSAGMSATMGLKIQNNSALFFQNMSRPSGLLTAPDEISDETAARLKQTTETAIGGGNLGRLLVGGSGLDYKPMTMPAEQSQLIEQLEWTAKDIARALHVPYFMVGGDAPANNTVEAETQRYYSQCVQKLLEQAEACLDSGLALPGGYRTEFDIDGLIRMDGSAMAEMLGKYVNGGIMAPNEARARIGLPPVAGGQTPYLQQQNYGLEALARRDSLANPFVIDRPTTNPTPSAAGPASTADPEDDPAKGLDLPALTKAFEAAEFALG